MYVYICICIHTHTHTYTHTISRFRTGMCVAIDLWREIVLCRNERVTRMRRALYGIGICIHSHTCILCARIFACVYTTLSWFGVGFFACWSCIEFIFISHLCEWHLLRSAWVCIYIHVYICVYIYITHIYIYIYIYIYIHIYIYIYVHIYLPITYT